MLYKVKAKMKSKAMKKFFAALTDGSIAAHEPDGAEMFKAMQEAKIEGNGTVSWYETCYCATPLKHERETVYDKYFKDFDTTLVYEVSDDIKGESFWLYLEEMYYDETYTF